MGWVKRTANTLIPRGRTAPEYVRCSFNFTIVMHHHGKFNSSMTAYDGGVVDYFDFCNVDEMSMIEIKEMMKMCGIDVESVKCYSSKSGINCCRQLEELVTDIHACGLGFIVDESDSVGLFIHHKNKEGEGVEGAEDVEKDEDEMEAGVESDDEMGAGVESDDETSDNDDDMPPSDEEDEGQGIEYDRSMYTSLVDDKDTYVPDFDDQSLGEDSVHSEGFNDSDCELTNENAEFYKNVKVHMWLGGLDGIDTNSTPAITMSAPSNPVVPLPSTYNGFKVFNYKTDMDDPTFEVGMVFEGNNVLRNAIRCHSIKHQKELDWQRNDKNRIVVRCLGQICPWRLEATSMGPNGKLAMQIKSLNGVHRCAKQDVIKAASSKWIAEQYEEEIMNIDKWSVKSMKTLIRSKKGVAIKKNKLYRAKKLAQEKKSGNEVAQYATLWRYAAEIKRSDPNNNVKIKSLKCDDGKQLFKRIYICWGATKKAFGSGLRKFICLDGCHLKGRNGGILLTAVGVDPNNSLYPIAYAVVGKEKTDTWEWFLEYLQKDLGIPEHATNFTFMLDKQKGLINTVESLFPDSEHRFCVVHLYNNMKIHHGGLALKNLLWKAAKCTREIDFESAMIEIKGLDEKAYKWLEKKFAEHWSKSHFRTNVKSDICVNNISKSFNKMLLEPRGKPIIELLEDIRMLLMKRIWVNRTKAGHWWGALCPLVREKLEFLRERSNTMTALYNGFDGFEVVLNGGGMDKWIVSMEEKTCSCRKWQLSGYPCSHAICCLNFLGLAVGDHVHDCYKRSTYMQVYRHVMQPIKGQNEWPKSDLPILLPPIAEKMPGRPKKNSRKKSSIELQEIRAKIALHKATETGRIGRHGIIMHCSYCSKPGHNKRNCAKRIVEEGEGSGSAVGASDAGAKKKKR